MLALMLAATGIASADRPEVRSIDAPDSARSGESVPITLNLHHEDTSPVHYVDYVRLYDGDRLLQEWTYGKNNPEKAEEWSLTYTGSFEKSTKLRAVIRCNLHGDSAATKEITVQ